MVVYDVDKIVAELSKSAAVKSVRPLVHTVTEYKCETFAMGELVFHADGTASGKSEEHTCYDMYFFPTQTVQDKKLIITKVSPLFLSSKFLTASSHSNRRGKFSLFFFTGCISLIQKDTFAYNGIQETYEENRQWRRLYLFFHWRHRIHHNIGYLIYERNIWPVIFCHHLSIYVIHHYLNGSNS